MKGIYQFVANLLSYIPTKYYWNRSTSDLAIAKSKRVSFFFETQCSSLRALFLNTKHNEFPLWQYFVEIKFYFTLSDCKIHRRTTEHLHNTEFDILFRSNIQHFTKATFHDILKRFRLWFVNRFSIKLFRTSSTVTVLHGVNVNNAPFGLDPPSIVLAKRVDKFIARYMIGLPY